MNAKVETSYDCGSPETLRDEYGGLWRVAANSAGREGLAVEEIEEYGGGSAAPAVEEAELMGEQPCGIAHWRPDFEPETMGALEIVRCRSHGENSTDRTSFDAGSGPDMVASASGWEGRDADE